jgi:hypothetical protein
MSGYPDVRPRARLPDVPARYPHVAGRRLRRQSSRWVRGAEREEPGQPDRDWLRNRPTAPGKRPKRRTLGMSSPLWSPPPDASPSSQLNTPNNHSTTSKLSGTPKSHSRNALPMISPPGRGHCRLSRSLRISLALVEVLLYSLQNAEPRHSPRPPYAIAVPATLTCSTASLCHASSTTREPAPERSVLRSKPNRPQRRSRDRMAGRPRPAASLLRTGP